MSTLKNICNIKLGETIDYFTIGTIHKWGLDFVKLIKLMGQYTRNQYILVVIDYVAIWVKAKMAQTNKIIVITRFLYKCI
jgi:hypothetical protein